MLSKFKTNIILGYTGLLLIIIVAILGLLYGILGFQIRQEIDHNLKDKIEIIDSWLKTDAHPPPCTKDFYKSVFVSRRITIYDVMFITEMADNKYLLYIRCADEKIFLSDKYKELEQYLEKLEVKENEIETKTLNGTKFSVSVIQKPGYSFIIGYELSTIKVLQQKIVRIFFISLPFIILGSVIFVFLFTQRLLRTVQLITETTASITSRNMNERIPVPTGKDEITNLIETINEMIDRLEKSFSQIRQFSQDAAHELRTPLTIIRSELENVMIQGKISKAISKSMENMLNEVHYISSIVNKLLILHSLDTNEKQYHFTSLDLHHIIDDLLEDAYILSAKNRIKLVNQTSGSLMIKGDEELIGQMIWNILDNAIKYTDKGGSVEISTAEKDSKIWIVIKDTGIGIPEESLHKIFTRFYRVEQSHSRRVVGSGLGLAISKWIAVLHCGEIFVKSELHKGSEFIVMLPVITKQKAVSS